MTRRQTSRASPDFNDVDMLFDLELEEQQLRVAERRLAAKRKLDDVDYWRKRAGWYDDDESMREYNNGIYNSYYSIDDDFAFNEATSSNLEDGGGGMSFNTDIIKTVGQVAGALLGIIILFMLVRAISRGSARRKKGESGGGGSGDKPRSKSRSGSRRRSTSRSRSKSRPRSRSKRSGTAGTGDDNYELMEDSKGQSSRPRSRSKARSSSRSKSRSRPSSSRKEELV